MATGQSQMTFGYDKPVYSVQAGYNNSGYNDEFHGYSGYNDELHGYNPAQPQTPAVGYSAAGGGSTSIIVGQPGPGMQESKEPFRHVTNWMCLSVFSLFCCIVCAVPSVAYAQAASVLKTVGRYQAAETKAKWALGCGLTSIILGLLYITALILLGLWGAGAF